VADYEHRTENDNDLHGDPFAPHWARRFAKKFSVIVQGPDGERRVLHDPEHLMLPWFASAIETGKMYSPLGLDLSEDVRSFLRKIVGDRTPEQIQRDKKLWENSSDLNEEWISDVVMTASELLLASEQDNSPESGKEVMQENANLSAAPSSELTKGLIFNRVRHPGVMHMGPHFAFGHLPENLQEVSKRFTRLAQYLVDTQEDGPELVEALRKLWESKNSAVLNAGFIADGKQPR
jgi:hypothetical protein